MLSHGMGELGHIDDERRDEILEEFYELCVAGDPLLLTNGVALNNLAEKFLDDEANKELQEALVLDKQARLELDKVDSKILANLIQRASADDFTDSCVHGRRRAQRFCLSFG